MLAEEEVLMVAIWVGVEEDGWWGRSLFLFGVVAVTRNQQTDAIRIVQLYY
jgi:hypothetical protein